MNQSPRRMIVSNLKLTEISTVDRPAVQGALAVLMKSLAPGDDVAIRKNAVEVAKGDTAPGFTVAQYEDAMFRRADELGATVVQHSLVDTNAARLHCNRASDCHHSA